MRATTTLLLELIVVLMRRVNIHVLISVDFTIEEALAQVCIPALDFVITPLKRLWSVFDQCKMDFRHCEQDRKGI